MHLSIIQLDSTCSASKLTDHQLHFVLFFSFWCFIDTFYDTKIKLLIIRLSVVESTAAPQKKHNTSSAQTKKKNKKASGCQDDVEMVDVEWRYVCTMSPCSDVHAGASTLRLMDNKDVRPVVCFCRRKNYNSWHGSPFLPKMFPLKY